MTRTMTCGIVHGVSAALFMIGTTLAASGQQQATIRIRFASGKTGKPLRLKSYERGEAATGAGGYQVKRVDGDSLVVEFKGVSKFSFRGASFEPCDTNVKDAPGPQYDLQDIVSKGAVSPNFCGHGQTTAKPGELVIFSRHERWWRVTKDVARGLLICG